MSPFSALILVAVAVSGSRGIATCFVHPRPRTCRTAHHVPPECFASPKPPVDANVVDEPSDTSALDFSRRKLLSSIAPAATLPFILLSDAASASTAVSPIDTELKTSLPVSPPAEQVNTAIALKNPPARTTLCADSAEESRIAIFEKVAPSVVFIDTFSEKRDVFSTNVMEVPIGSGSGYVWDTDGHIVTNFHVVQSAKSAQVAILTPGAGGSSAASIKPSYTGTRGGSGNGSVLKDFTRNVYKAKVVGVDPTKDIAVLKVDGVPVKELRPIEVGTSTGLRVGQGSLAIGNPFGLDHTLTTGVISGIGREVKSPIGRPISNVIQTDAAINPGVSTEAIFNC